MTLNERNEEIISRIFSAENRIRAAAQSNLSATDKNLHIESARAELADARIDMRIFMGELLVEYPPDR